MDAEDWDARYRDTSSLWSLEPNVFVAERLAEAPPGRALDLTGGEGRNALWLAARGWTVELVEFSTVALARAQQRADADALTLTLTHADVTTTPLLEPADLVLLSYLHLPSPTMARVAAWAAGLVRPGGRMLLVGHARRNLTEGTGGPADIEVLQDPATVRGWFESAGLTVVEAREVTRTVETDEGPRPAIDVVVDAHR